MATDRRSRFREYMRRLDPTGDPAQAIAAGFYVPPPDAVSRRIATRLELEPSSGHLLVGGIGSGKSSEMIALEGMLADVDDLRPVRVDVPSRHRLDKLQPGVLVALAAMEACAELARERKEGLSVDEQIEKDIGQITTLARGYYWDPNEAPDWEPEPEDFMNWTPGILEAPQRAENVETLAAALSRVQGTLRKKLVLLFDGLDRVADLTVLAAVLAEDVPAMRRAGIGLVVVGPQHLRFSPQRTVEKEFETVHLHGATGVDSSEGDAFLVSVLRARAAEEMLPEESAMALTRWSGGLLRDLVALGRAAGAEAYADGSEAIHPAHVSTAADRFGRDLLLGCTKEMAIRLKEVTHQRFPRPGAGARPRPGLSPAFTVATELDQRLLLERLIIEVPGTPVSYVLHPTIAPLVAGLGGS